MVQRCCGPQSTWTVTTSGKLTISQHIQIIVQSCTRHPDPGPYLQGPGRRRFQVTAGVERVSDRWRGRGGVQGRSEQCIPLGRVRAHRLGACALGYMLSSQEQGTCSHPISAFMRMETFKSHRCPALLACMQAVSIAAICSLRRVATGGHKKLPALLAGRQCASSYCVRKGLIRKAHLAHNLKKWAAKHPSGRIAECVPETLIMDIDHPDYFDEAMNDCYEVRNLNGLANY